MKQILMQYKQFLIPTAILIPIIYYVFSSNETNQATLLEPISSSNPHTQTIQEQPNNEDVPQQILKDIYIDVKGAVQNPGVYKLQEGDRIIDAIQLAGGYTEEADATMINHAQKVTDEMVVYVPKEGEEITETIQQPSHQAETNGQSNPGKINLNTATVEQLTSLPGIGPSKAQAIIAYREENGQFQTIDDLKNVSGIGDKTFEKLKSLIDV